MKKLIVNCFATTAISLLLLAGYAGLMGGSAILISAIFECLFTNIIIHLGLACFRKLEWEHILWESILHMGYMMIVVIVFGAVFDWFSSTPVSILVIMAAALYLSGLLLRIFHTHKEAKTINGLLQRRQQTKE